MKMTRLMTLTACAGLAAPALAQDSVSSTGAGDALDAYNTANQVTKFVTTLTPFTSSLGNSYGIAPLLKPSASLPTSIFAAHLPSGQAMSRNIINNINTSGAYATWTTAGPGVHATENSAPGSVNAPASGLMSVGVAFAEFGDSANNIIAGSVSFDPSSPETLYVDRIISATNQTTGTVNTDNSQFGMGVIDAHLNTTIRVDGFGTTGGNVVTGNNIYRINSELRANGTLNEINGSGGTDAAATEGLLVASATTHSPPSQVPEANGGPSSFGPNFNSELVHTDHTIGTLSHLSSTLAGLSNATDQRGTFGFSPVAPLGGVGTAIGLGRIAPADTVDLTVFGVDANGAPQSIAVIQAPVMISDPVDGYVASFGEFRGYRSQMAFRGPSGTASVSTDAVTGEVLAAGVFDITGFGGVVYGGGAAQAPLQGIAVASFDPANAAATMSWNLAAWVDGSNGTGKPVFNGSGTQIGELTALSVFAGQVGPSISGVSMDAAGNIYFVAPFFDYGPDGMIGGTDDDFDSALFRAIYDSATNGYDLELLLQTGNVFTSANTGLDYVITFLDIADGNSTSSGTFFGHNTTFEGYPGLANPLDPSDHFNLGGLVISMDMTYDVNGDGSFDENNGDEGYNYIFYIAPLGNSNITDCNNNGVDDATDIANGTSTDLNGDGIPDECPGQSTRLCADVNNDGSVTPADFTAWIAAFNALNYRADQNSGGLGAVTPADFTAWIANFNQGGAGPTCLN